MYSDAVETSLVNMVHANNPNITWWACCEVGRRLWLIAIV